MNFPSVETIRELIELVQSTVVTYLWELFAYTMGMAIYGCSIGIVLVLFGAPFVAVGRRLVRRALANPESRYLNAVRYTTVAVMGVFYVVWMTSAIAATMHMLPVSAVIDGVRDLLQSIKFA